MPLFDFTGSSFLNVAACAAFGALTAFFAALCVPTGGWLLASLRPETLTRTISSIAVVLAPLFIGATWPGNRLYHRSGASLCRPAARSLLAMRDFTGCCADREAIFAIMENTK